MIEMRWKPIPPGTEIPEEGVVKLFKPSPPDVLAVRTVEADCFVVLQYREGLPAQGHKSRGTVTEWKDVEIEE